MKYKYRGELELVVVGDEFLNVDQNYPKRQCSS